jgi:molecular chaperone DnaK (HSP70)
MDIGLLFFGVFIGIDLGTTFSVVAAIASTLIVVAENREGNLLTPSVVCFSEDGKAVVGETAMHMMIARLRHCVWEVKRLMGEAVTAFIHPDTGQKYSPVEISALILKELKDYAERFYGEQVEGVVITVPAYFDSKARQETEEAGKLAGLNVLRILNEPSAAVLAYSFSHKMLRGIFAVVDLGGGTFDISIAEVTETGIRILASDGTGALEEPTLPSRSRRSSSMSSARPR